VDELQNGAVTRTYSYGLERISETQSISGTATTSFYGFDGHGSVRQLLNSFGAITDTYDYDAFGNLINQIGSTPNNYLFAGEQFDPALNLYYNRARYLNTNTGRFWNMDTYEGAADDPPTLHHYVFAFNDPTDVLDHSGKSGESDATVWGKAVHAKISGDFNAWLTLRGHVGYSNVSIKTILGATIRTARQRDILTSRFN